MNQQLEEPSTPSVKAVGLNPSRNDDSCWESRASLSDGASVDDETPTRSPTYTEVSLRYVPLCLVESISKYIPARCLPVDHSAQNPRPETSLQTAMQVQPHRPGTADRASEILVRIRSRRCAGTYSAKGKRLRLDGPWAPPERNPIASSIGAFSSRCRRIWPVPYARRPSSSVLTWERRDRYAQL